MTAAPPPVVGFRAHLRGASLWDLVQMECLGRSRGVFQVTGEGGVGYLYIAGGRVVHAVTRRLEGEAAALEILGWTNGSFQPCDRIWPPAPTIDTPYEKLMLLVATRQDEERSSSSNLVAFPGRGPVAPTAVTPLPDQSEFELLEIAEEGHTDMRNPNDQDATSSLTGRNDATAPFPVVIRLSASGTVANKGGTDELAEAVAYVHRLAQLSGEILGLDAFTAMECTFVTGRCLVFNDTNGDVVAVRPNPETNLQTLREKLGL
jgi:Domain of unknown function (DUF4388)